MDLFLISLESVAALLGIGILGYWIIRRHVIPENLMGFLAPLALDIALPSLVFISIVQQFDPAEFPDWWQLPLIWIGFTAVLFGLVMATSFFSQKETRREFAISLFFQNGLFFPIFIITGVFGPNSPYLVTLFLFLILHPPLVFGSYYLFFGKKEGAVNWHRILNPILIMTVLAVLLCVLSVQQHVPTFLVSIFEMLGGMALPLLMLILGGNIYIDFKTQGKMYIKEAAKFTLTKNILFPLVFIGLLYVIRLDYNISLIIFLQAAVPPITAIPILTERSGGNRNITTQFIFTSFVFSILSIPSMFFLFNMLVPAP